MKTSVLVLSALCAGAAFSHTLVPAPTSCTDGAGWFLAGTRPQADWLKVTRDAAVPREGYRLTVASNGVTVVCSDAAGEFYARQTLAQLAETKAGGGVKYPCVAIEDAPRYGWRGVHFDDCRHFFGKQVLKKTLDLMAQHKLNVLHWHLTDDQGWRLDIPGHPELVKYGAVRSQSVLFGKSASTGKQINADRLDRTPYGPFYYTEADVKEILAYAAERHVRIVPEIELPGHVQAVLAAYPELACVPENVADRDPRVVWGIAKDVLCLGNDKSIRLFEDVLDYVCRTFPGEVVHIGGDECPQDRWKTCPKCQARIKAEKLGDEKGLQPWVTRHFVRFLESRGKRALGWDEYLLGDVPKSAIGMSWREGRDGAGHELVSGAAAAVRGHDVVMTPTSYCYLDYAQGLPDDPYQYIGGRLPLQRCYSFDPCAGVPEEARKHVLGGQGNNWSEFTWTKFDLEWKMWPRLCALSEVFWTGEGRPGFADFRARMETHRRRLIAQGVNCAPLAAATWKPPERWRGVNLVNLFHPPWKHGEAPGRGRFHEENFRWLRQWGFNFARLPLDYRNLAETNDVSKIKLIEEGFRKVDEAIEFGAKYGIHVQVCLHRAPGFTICYWDPEPLRLQTDKGAQKGFFDLWRYFARRYRGIPNERLSFNPLNEPQGFKRDEYVHVFGNALKAIRGADPDRFVMLDGNGCASTPVWEFKDEPLTGQAFRGYTPHAISHYGARYIKDQPAVEPTWPMDPDRIDSRWIFEQPEETLAKFERLARTGYPVMVGEFGCYNKISHATCLKWMEHCLKLWQERNLGWAIWNLNGPFGFVDSDRADVEYEDFEGHKLDRKMLELLQRY